MITPFPLQMLTQFAAKRRPPAPRDRTSMVVGTLLFVLMLSSCAKDNVDALTERELYLKASSALKSNNFSEATRRLEVLENRFPFGPYAEQAQLDLIYARYGALDIDGALFATNRFIRLHPDSKHVDYAYYIRGLINYNYDQGLAARWFPINVEERDAGRMRDAYQDFSRLLERYPDSDYAADARQRMVSIRNRLAAHELAVVKYYLRREAYVAAVNRCQYILENYPDSPSTEQALILMVELYRFLGQDEFADDTIVLLAANFPDSFAFDENMKFKSKKVLRQNRSLSRLLDINWPRLFGSDDSE